jgi:hypothetical protein
VATLILNLLVDGTGRSSEMLPNSPEKVAEGQFLKWEDVEIWAFPDTSGATTPIIRINITFKWLKLGTYDPEVFKTIVVQLLSPHLVFQDYCRLIILLALIDGTLADFQSWEQIATCKPNPDSSMIRINAGHLKLPVFAKSALTGLEEDALKPWHGRPDGTYISIIRVPR